VEASLGPIGLRLEFGDEIYFNSRGHNNQAQQPANHVWSDPQVLSYAAAEFQKILDHSGIVWHCWTGALAHLGMARANALQSRTSRGADADAARVRPLAAYKDFLTL
jgi:hypothetical protein